MGGLGANIGSEDWERAQLKKEQQKQYAEAVRHTVKPVPKPQRAPLPKEPTAREKALEFARQVPKPKARPQAAEQLTEEDFGDEQHMYDRGDTMGAQD